MIDLREKFAAADELTPPNLWIEALRRAAIQLDLASTTERIVDRPRRRLPAAIVAIVTVTVAAIFAWNALSPLKQGAITPSPPPVAPPRPLGITGTLRLPFGDFGVVANANQVWVASYGHVLRVDPTRLAVTATVRVPGLDDQDGIAVGEKVWVTVGSRHEVVAIDPATADIVRTVMVPNYPLQVAAEGSDVWVISATNGAGRIYHIEGATGVVTSIGRLSTSPRLPFAAGGGSAWVAEGSGLRRFAPDGSTATVDIPGGEVSALTFGDGSVWALLSGGGILRIDPSSDRVIARLPSPSGIGLAETTGRVWILTDTGSTSKSVYIPDPHDPSEVILLDANTGRITGPAVKVGFAPAWISAGGPTAWVAKFNSARLLRISTVPAGSEGSLQNATLSPVPSPSAAGFEQATAPQPWKDPLLAGISMSLSQAEGDIPFLAKSPYDSFSADEAMAVANQVA